MHEAATLSDAPPMNLGQRLAGMFTSPGRVFASLRQHPAWLDVLLIAIVAGVLTFLPIRGLVQRDSIEQGIERIEKMDNLSAAQKEQAIERQREMMEGPVFTGFAFGGAIVGTPIMLLLWALLVWVCFGFMAGGDMTFKRSLAAVGHLNILFIAAAAIKIPMMVMRESIHVSTGLALLSPDPDPRSVVYSALDSFDFFTLLILVVMASAMPRLARITPKRSWTMTVVLFLIGLLLRVGGAALGAMFS